MNNLTTITRKVLSLLLVIAMAFAGTVLCFADDMNVTATEENISGASTIVFEPDRWDNASSVSAEVWTSGKKIKVAASIRVKDSSSKVSGYLYLEEKSGGRWKSVQSWKINQTGNVDITKSTTYTKGNTYRARVKATVGGETVEDVSDSIEG